MRTNKALKNTIFSTVSYFLLLVSGFITQKVFKDSLGVEYLGINSLYANIITGLNIVELGFGSAIIADMYKPIANKDTKLIVSFLGYYKKIYRYIAGIVFTLGLFILPFVPKIVGNVHVLINLRFLFLLYLLDTVVSYFLTYKRSILYANQESYITTCIHTIAIILTNILQIFFLLNIKNFYFYLVISIVFRVLENALINIVVNKRYLYVKQTPIPLSEENVIDIKKKVNGLLFHKIASFIVLGTDNIIISMMPNLGISWVGVYANYSLITTKLTALVDNIFNSITASIGNLLVEDNKVKSYDMFRKLKFINTWIYVLFSTCFYYVSFPFIELWMGRDYVLDKTTVLVISINFLLGGLRASYGAFKNAAGIFYEDRYVPIVESSVNIILSIPLASLYGVKGVLLGTIGSTMILYVYSYPKFVYEHIFNKDKRQYWIDWGSSIYIYIITMVVTGICVDWVNIDNVLQRLLLTTLICAIVPNAVIVLFSRKMKEFSFCIDIFKKIFLKLRIGAFL